MHFGHDETKRELFKAYRWALEGHRGAALLAEAIVARHRDYLPTAGRPEMQADDLVAWCAAAAQRAEPEPLRRL